MNRRLLFLLSGFALIFAGCTMAPKYTQPSAPIPAEWPQGAAYKNTQVIPEAPTAPELSRQAFFADNQLRAIIEIALENNRDLRLAALNVERARALYGIQRAELFPVVNAAGAGGKHRLSSDLISPGDPRTVEQYNVGLGIAAWEIDFFGRIQSLKDQALEEYLSTEEARRSAQIALIFEVARAYLSLAADRENLQLARSTLETQQASYDLIQRQYAAGIANELDLRQAQTQVETARRDLARYTQMAALGQNEINLLAGSIVPKDLLPKDLTGIPSSEEIFAGISSAALLSRPDILAAEHQLKGAYAFIGAARAAFFPRISLTTSVGTASSELSGLFGSGTGTWSFVPEVAVPIFDARTWAAYRVSKAQQEIAITRYEKTIQVAFREVADALAVKGMVDQQIAAQQSLTHAVAETYRLADKRYQKGIDSYLGVLDAQQSLYIQQRVLIALRLEKLTNQVRLYAVLGGGGE
jgi:multidrug efflux system outer membrane protein